MWEVYLDRDDIEYLKEVLEEELCNVPEFQKRIERILHALEYASIPAKHEEVECKQRTGAE